jgi:hypothetical protein
VHSTAAPHRVKDCSGLCIILTGLHLYISPLPLLFIRTDASVHSVEGDSPTVLLFLISEQKHFCLSWQWDWEGSCLAGQLLYVVESPQPLSTAVLFSFASLTRTRSQRWQRRRGPRRRSIRCDAV